MKQRPTTDYAVRATDVQWEWSDDGTAAGIYKLDLNYWMVNIMFVPSFERTQENWPPPNDIESSGMLPIEESSRGVRWLVAVTERYIVTPDAERAGTEDVLPDLSADDPHDACRIVFYVSPEEFSAYAAELEDEINVYSPPYFSPPRVSELQHLRVIQLLEGRILSHPAFNPSDLRWLRDSDASEEPALSEEQAALHEYATWLRLWLSAQDRGEDAELLRRYARGLGEARRRCTLYEQSMNDEERGELRAWAQQRLADLPDLEKRYDAAGGSMGVGE